MSIDRRTFLGAATLAGAASALPESTSTPRQFDVKKSLKVEMIKGARDLTEAFEFAKQAGFDGVEMSSPNKYELADVLIAKKSTGLDVPGVVLSTHWQRPFNHPDEKKRAEAVKNLEQAIDDCAAYGGDTVLVVPAVVNEKYSYADAWDRSLSEIKKVLPRCERTGIKLAFENVWNNFLLSPLEAARYVDAFESDFVGWYFDVGNVVNYGWPEQWIEVLDDRILKLDVKDFSRSLRDNEGLWSGFNAPLGEGDANWNAVVNALRDIGYEGWASAEVKGGDVNELMVIMDRMRRCFNF